MNQKILLDTNTVTYALNHNLTLPKKGYAISILTDIELRSCDKFQNIISHFKIYKVNKAITKKAIEIRKNYALSLDDSIICATAIIHKNLIVTQNKNLSQVSNLRTFLITAWKDKQ
ncbi:MAG: Unknown protein [uncultured Sulfurovum sp.]|uniref:PIN domain-containing protein n=1 Tax=uncultured Sulfurovum sp. TaxID=269237 RepID=A0A6S6UAM2_9BACT|nr:MAG: Unknown protein [uncultured Sulfurovum sp.]